MVVFLKRTAASGAALWESTMRNVLNENVLVLNRLWQAINVCTVERAFMLLYMGHAEVVIEDAGNFQTFDFHEWREFSQGHHGEDVVHTVSFKIRVPRVILLLFLCTRFSVLLRPTSCLPSVHPCPPCALREEIRRRTRPPRPRRPKPLLPDRNRPLDDGSPEPTPTSLPAATHSHWVGDRIYADSDALRKCGALPGCYLRHLGMGDFALETPHGEVEFNRSAAVDFPVRRVGRLLQGPAARPSPSC